MKNTFYLLLFWLGLSLRVPAQAIWSADFPFAGELPSNEMTELYQDEDGFVWIGTTNGLSRYDGYRLQTFTLLGMTMLDRELQSENATSPALRKTVHTFGSEREKD